MKEVLKGLLPILAIGIFNPLLAFLVTIILIVLAYYWPELIFRKE